MSNNVSNYLEWCLDMVDENIILNQKKLKVWNKTFLELSLKDKSDNSWKYS
jgi:hypothetical protein